MHPKTSSRLPTSMTYLEFSCFIKAFPQGILGLLHNWRTKSYTRKKLFTGEKKKMIQVKGCDKKEAENVSFLLRALGAENRK